MSGRRRLPVPAAALVAALLGTASCASLPEARIADGGDGGRFVEVDGRRVFLVEAGQGPPVVLLHGFGASSYSWRLVLPRLAASHRVLAPDLYGFGWSERPEEFEPYSRRGQVDLVERLMDRMGLASAHLVGHSYGGGLALTLAALRPERVRSLVLVASTAPDYADQRRHPVAALRPWAWLWTRFALRPAFVERSLRRSVEDESIVTPGLVDAYLERLRIRGVARAYRGLTRPRRPAPDLPEVRLEAISQPALVVWGRHDRLIELRYGRQAADRLPRARWRVFEDCGHLPPEEAPDRLAAEILDFLASVEAAPTAPPTAPEALR